MWETTLENGGRWIDSRKKNGLSQGKGKGKGEESREGATAL